MTGVIDNGTAEIEYTYDQSGVGGVVACVGESSYGPIGTNPAVATPTFSPAPGAYGLAQSVTLADTTPGAVIYYTTNGTAPTIQSAVYTGPIQISATTTIQAIAVASDSNNSAIAAGTYFYGPTQSLTFPPIPTQTYPTGPIVLSATASSNLPVTFSVVPNGNCSVSGSTVTFLNEGNCGVIASQAGNSSYLGAPAVGQIILVNNATPPKAQTISFNAIPAQSVGHTLLLSATASSGLPVSYVIVPNGNCSIAGSTVTFLNQGVCGVVATQGGNTAYAPAVAVGQAISVN